MQTNNQNEKHEATLLACLDKALLFKGKKVREGKGKTKVNNLTRLASTYTYVKAFTQTGHMEH